MTLDRYARSIGTPIPLESLNELSEVALRLVIGIWKEMLRQNTQRRIVKTNKRIANLARMTVPALYFAQQEIHEREAFWMQRDERDPDRSFEDGQTAYSLTPAMVRFMVNERSEAREAEKKLGWGRGCFLRELIET